MRGAARALFVYGSLAPHAANAAVLAGLRGKWIPARTRGILRVFTRGPEQGYRVLVPTTRNEWVAGQLFMSSQLPMHWPRLDRFEGPHYRRSTSVVQVQQSPSWSRTMQAQVYILNAPLAWTQRVD